MPQLKIKDQGKVKIYEILEDSLHIGKSGENQIRVQDDAVAGIHCEIKRTRDGYKLIDLESKAGTRVNGEYVNQHLLEDGDIVKIGSTVMKFEQDEAVVLDGASTKRRLERERGFLDDIPTWGVISIIGGGALLLVVVLLALFRGSGPTKAQRRLQLAQEYRDKGQLEQALQVITQARSELRIDPVIERAFRDIEEGIASETVAKEELATGYDLQKDMQDTVLAFAKEHQGDLEMREEVLARFDQWLRDNAKWIEENPGNSLVPNLESNRAIVEKNYKTLEERQKRRDNW